MQAKSSASGYYLIKKSAVPKVLQQVVAVNRLLASGKAKTVNEAAEMAGISRSTYYKYAGDVEEFHDSAAGTTVNLSAEVSDETGLLSDMLSVIAKARANILTIHQSIPIDGVASVSISIQVREDTENVSVMVDQLKALSGVRRIKISGGAG